MTKLASCLVIIASRILKDVLKSKKTNKIVVFLGGECSDDNQWRKDIKKEFSNRIFFIDPYDPDWDPEDNIYDELAGMMVADKIVFYRGGKGSKKEKKFLDVAGNKYVEFDSLDKLGQYLEGLKGDSR